MLRRFQIAGFAFAVAALLVPFAATWADEIEIIPRVEPPVPAVGPVPAVEPVPATKATETDGQQATYNGLVDVRFADGSTLKLTLKQDSYDLATPYGKLTIPAKEMRLVEMAPRVPDNVATQIEEAVANLESPQFEIREKAMADLVKIGPLGYPVLLRFARTKDLEVAARMEEILEQVRAKLPEDQAEPREWDIVHTGLSRIAGRLEVKSLQAESAQFGEVELKLADVRDLRFQGGFEEIDLSKLDPAPANLYDKASQIGKTFTYKVTGNMAGGAVYGTDTYTLDSSLAMAAVHASVVKNGQTGVLRVKIVDSPASFTSSTRNGITSHAWGPYPAAYKIIKTR